MKVETIANKMAVEIRDCIVKSTYQTTMCSTIFNPMTKEVKEVDVVLNRDRAVKKINAHVIEEINAHLPEGWRHVSSEVKDVKVKKFAMKKDEFYANAMELED